MRIKDNAVNLQGLRPEMIIGLMVANGVYIAHGKDMVITCALDGKHSVTSLHYAGCAVDIRTNYFTKATAIKVRDEIKERLGIDFDVILESDHLHIEYQPRWKG
jgi:hypothetical protein